MVVFVMPVFLLSDIEKTCFVCVLEIIEPKKTLNSCMVKNLILSLLLTSINLKDKLT